MELNGDSNSTQPLPTWPAATIITLMTVAFGLSVAVYCGELDCSQSAANQRRSIVRTIPNPEKATGNEVVSEARSAKPAVSKMVAFSKPAIPPVQPAPAKTTVPNAFLAQPAVPELHAPEAFPKNPPQMQPTNAGFASPTLHFNLFLAGAAASLAGRADELRPRVQSLLSAIASASDASSSPIAIGVPPQLEIPANILVVDSPIVIESDPPALPVAIDAWPPPAALLQLIGELPPVIGDRPWQAELVRLLNELAAVNEIGDPDVGSLLADLSQISDQMWDESRAIASSQSTDEQRAVAADLSRASYALHRQVDIWQAVHKLALDKSLPADFTGPAAQSVAFAQRNFENVDPAWREYLGLDLLDSSDSSPQEVARVVLARMHSVGLTAEQTAVVQKIVRPEFESELRRAAAEPLDLRQILVDIESFQQQPNGRTIARLNDHFQNCVWSDQATAGDLAQHLEDHYRNANVRIAIAESLMNRILSRPHSADEPVRDQILGANVSGRSHITNQLGVQLVPDEQQWSLVLTTSGNVLSRTQAHRDGFVVHSVGSANVFGSKRMSISYNGVASELPQVEAVTDNQVIGLDSPYDDIPMVGWTARRIAQRKQREAEPVADQIVRSRIRSRVQERMEQAVTAALQKVKAELDRLIVSRFIEWSLEPQPIEMRTTDSDVILRYRLAGFDQMGADTPRPAIDDQMAVSLQLHASAVNNGLARLDLADQEFTMATLAERLRSKLRLELKSEGEDLHAVEIGFAPYDPVRVDFSDDQVRLTMNLKRLQIDKGKNWRNVTVQTSYAVRFDGFYLTLEQVGGVKASGSRLRVRDELAIGSIFNQLLNDEYRFSLLPQEYADDFAACGVRLAYISLDDGWLSVAYQESPAVPQEANQNSRILPRLRVP